MCESESIGVRVKIFWFTFGTPFNWSTSAMNPHNSEGNLVWKYVSYYFEHEWH